MLHTTETAQHNVYVIELDKEVLKFDEFVKANPQYKEGMPCLFVGETRHTPQKRFNYHLVGYKSHEFVRRHARRLAPEYYARINPVDADQAKVEDATCPASRPKNRCRDAPARRRPYSPRQRPAARCAVAPGAPRRDRRARGPCSPPPEPTSPHREYTKPVIPAKAGICFNPSEALPLPWHDR